MTPHEFPRICRTLPFQLTVMALMFALIVVIMVSSLPRRENDTRASEEITVITITNVESVFIRHTKYQP